MPKLRNRDHPRDSISILFRGVSRHMRDQFKAYCARRGLTMTDAVIEYMRRCVNTDAPPTPRLRGLPTEEVCDES